MRDIDVLIIGGGVCGVLAGARFAREGFSYKIIEKNHDYGGVWAYRANGYSHLQVSLLLIMRNFEIKEVFLNHPNLQYHTAQQ